MVEQRGKKLNQLFHDLPEGLIVDSLWLSERGYAGNLRSHYVEKNWLEQLTRSVYQRPRRGAPKWQQVVISLQTILDYSPLVVGGGTALEVLGYSHYVPQKQNEIHLYGPKPPPAWINKLPLEQKFIYHSNKKLFGNNLPTQFLTSKELITSKPWGQWEWVITLSSPERAILELLDELPNDADFHNVDMIMQGLSSLSPKKLQKLLNACKSVKVNRLFFFFADRHKHAWLKQLNKKDVEFGSGKRKLVEGGKFDNKYQITVPEDINNSL